MPRRPDPHGGLCRRAAPVARYAA